MELSKKTTILLTPEMHKRLTRLAKHRGVSLGTLVREACAQQYGLVGAEDRIEAVRALAALSLPVVAPQQMKVESVLDPETLLP